MSSNQFNPFARSKLKIVEPLALVKCEFDGWTSSYKLEYRATRSAANVGLLGKQFKIGTPLVVDGKHVVVREANLTQSNSTVDEVTIRVEAVSFAAVLAGALNTPANSTATVIAGSAIKAGEAVYLKPANNQLLRPTGRRILL